MQAATGLSLAHSSGGPCNPGIGESPELAQQQDADALAIPLLRGSPDSPSSVQAATILTLARGPSAGRGSGRGLCGHAGRRRERGRGGRSRCAGGALHLEPRK